LCSRKATFACAAISFAKGHLRPFALRKNRSALRLSLRAWVVLMRLLVLSRLIGGDFDADATDLRKTMRAAGRVLDRGFGAAGPTGTHSALQTSRQKIRGGRESRTRAMELRTILCVGRLDRRLTPRHPSAPEPLSGAPVKRGFCF
jgi:hypothetical protein